MAGTSTPARSRSSSLPVRVVLRERPSLPSEAASATAPCVSLLDSHAGGEVTVQLKDQHGSRKERHKLDAFFGQEDSCRKIFDQEVRPVIPSILEGINATVFAYGAAGSGKTYTMQGTEDFPGLIPLAASTILAQCTRTRFSVDISYYEVYMERCYDLLEPKAKEVMAWDDKDGNLQLKGLSWATVRSMEEFQELHSIGIQRRKVAHTGVNDVSSRSHAVLSLRVGTDVVEGKLNLIDLAGSEDKDNRRNLNVGIRLQESTKINQSLFALFNVFSALKKNEHRIPYRDSKLTRILQDSLGGNSHVVMITCLNPAKYQESANTLNRTSHSCHVDIDVKLRPWLKSKGKTKSTQRMDRLLTPLANKNPLSMSHMKQPTSSRFSCRSKAMGRNGGKINKMFIHPEVHVPTENMPRVARQTEVNTPKKVVLPSVTQFHGKDEASLRKALSPIPSNMVPVKTTDTGDVEVLNVANKEQLQQLKIWKNIGLLSNRSKTS